MDVHAALEEVARWCEQQTAAGEPDELEVDCHAEVVITIGESAPPWRVRWERRSTAGASAPVAQLRYDCERRVWTLHHGLTPQRGWCSEEEALCDSELEPLLEAVAADRTGRFQGLPPRFRLTLGRPPMPSGD
jgi:hypothetical protein